MTDLARLRQEYMRGGLDEKDAPADPLALFDRWFDDAMQAALTMVNAMALSTVSLDGRPSSRIVLLKDVDDSGFVFYTNYESRKGVEINRNAHAALLFAWLPLERQIRIDGTLTKVSAAESDGYFETRPLGSRHAAIASPQSEQLENRAALEARFNEITKTTGDAPPRPAYWGGYRLLPQEIEFWQGRENRLHDRLLFSKTAYGWKTTRLAP